MWLGRVSNWKTPLHDSITLSQVKLDGKRCVTGKFRQNGEKPFIWGGSQLVEREELARPSLRKEDVVYSMKSCYCNGTSLCNATSQLCVSQPLVLLLLLTALHIAWKNE